ncbi:hypothetical protein BTN50_1723 (plasmid) [Candidatus Enterovibrio altilux]|uniref:Uncharacterized protein n=1 Tax=Candidatus Enterovibrio altilux TaxID=1927128 RepID=A0A291BAW7_9GAMM|nr:hypothetical protein BTN50_1723 [Candidatus Enterovibrio luxaltus]
MLCKHMLAARLGSIGVHHRFFRILNHARLLVKQFLTATIITLQKIIITLSSSYRIHDPKCDFCITSLSLSTSVFL